MKPFKPMLAVACDDLTKVVYPVYVSEKIDGCFSYDALITTNKGLVKIGDIVDKKLKLKALSYNQSKGTLEFK